MTAMQSFLMVVDDVIADTHVMEDKNKLIAFKTQCAKFVIKERQQLYDAMMHSLDEDGHTGEWKFKFINNYLDKLYGL